MIFDNQLFISISKDGVPNTKLVSFGQNTSGTVVSYI